MENILYTIGCPKCEILEAKLAQKNIEYSKFTDAARMIKMGITSLPKLKIDDKLMDFSEAVNWINSLGDTL